VEERDCDRRKRRGTDRSKKVMIPYGLSVDPATLRPIMLHVSKVPSGHACGCVCPSCKAPLSAKKCNDVDRASHFAHQGNRKCTNAFETMLHLLAKQIIQRAGWIILPEVVARGASTDWQMTEPSKDRSAIAVNDKGEVFFRAGFQTDRGLGGCYVNAETASIVCNHGGTTYIDPPGYCAYATAWEILTNEDEPRPILAFSRKT
jgi:hypothetical protein